MPDLPKTKYAAYPMLDFPTAWRLAGRGLIHTTWRCSYVQTWGGSLCDCGAIQREWDRLRELAATARRPR